MKQNKWAVVTDFDGTVTLKDVSDAILLHFGIADRYAIERAYDPGVRMEKWMRTYFRPGGVTKAEIEAYVLGSARLRSGFRELHGFCAANDIPLEIASGGVDLYIDCLLKEWRLKVSSFYGRARATSKGLVVDYPCLRGTNLDKFKAARVRHYQDLGRKVAFCGDGTSDLKAARAADAVFATKRLRRFCMETGVPSRQLKNFHTVKSFLLKNS